MKRWIGRLKVWIIHRLGGYTLDEATPNRNIQRLALTRRFTTELIRESAYDVHMRERERALADFVDSISPFVNIEEHRDYETREWVLRLSLRVVDDCLL